MISLKAASKSIKGTIPIAASKSESNRALIIQALCDSPFELHNLSSARDTQTMIRLLESEGHVLDVIDAGTTMRFLTAYFSAVGRDQILTGTPRMCKRPIGILVDALRSLGAEIEYWKQEGYPPLHIISKGDRMVGGELTISGSVSSQFITALLLIGPTLKGGLTLHLEGNIASKPYISMTLGLMEYFGVKAEWNDRIIRVPEKEYQPREYTIESDWSAASYWYSMVALAENAEIKLLGLRDHSLQGDSHIAKLMESFGVKTTYQEDGILLTKTNVFSGKELDIDFYKTPDLAQTIAVVSAATGLPVRMKGLETLRIKETDRILALQNELGNFNVSMSSEDDVHFTVKGDFSTSFKPVETYEDHRMAMAFAPLIMVQDELMIKEPEVVKKSYPEFWEHLELVGVTITEW